MKNPKKLIGIRLSKETQKDLEAIADNFGLSVNATVVFLTHIGINEIKKWKPAVNPQKFFINKHPENEG